MHEQEAMPTPIRRFVLSSSSKSIDRPSFSLSLAIEDSAYDETEKSSDERALDLFHKYTVAPVACLSVTDSCREYFSQFRPYFKHRAIVKQFVDHLWNHMGESSKVACVKRMLKEQGMSDVSTVTFNDSDFYSNDGKRNERRFSFDVALFD